MNIGIINTSTSNIQSVKNALFFLEYTKYKIINSIKDYSSDITHLIFPGVGTFKSNMDIINEKKLNLVILDAYKKKIYYLGICIGMQILATSGEERGIHEGLNIIQGKVKIINTKKRLPHIGWSEVKILKKKEVLFNSIEDNESFYFVHSFAFEKCNEAIAVTNYGESFVSVVKKNTFYGVQFHPEKSQKHGLILIKNFLSLK